MVSLEVGDCVRSAEDVGEGEGDGDDGGSLASMDVPLILSANPATLLANAASDGGSVPAHKRTQTGQI